MLQKDLTADPTVLVQLLAERQATIDKLTEQLCQLQQRLDKLLHLLYGTKSERQKPKELSVKEVVESQSTYSKPTLEKSLTGHGRRPLPPELPRVRVEYDLIGEQQYCSCGCKMQRLGTAVSEQLDCKPVEFFVVKHVRYKYVCRNCNQITTAPLPPQPIDKGLPGAGLLAEVILNKYQDALPLYRQEQRFTRFGIDLPRSTLCDWISGSALLLEPVVALMKKDNLLPGYRIFTDDTPVPVLAKGKTHTGRLWVYVGGVSDNPNCVVYDYTPTRSQSGPKSFLKDYRGYLQADAYAGYDCLYKTGDIIEVACFAHARRKFFEITLAAKETGKADIALEFMGELYGVERKAKPLTPLQRKFYRRRYSRPILDRFYRWLKKTERMALPKTPIGLAVAYTLNHWKALRNYCRDGILNIDNNTAERAIKPLVIGRKNWLFAGSHEGAKRAAVLYSIIETCKLNGINPYFYIKDVLIKLPSTLMKDLKQLLPYHWKP
jgi:transposase